MRRPDDRRPLFLRRTRREGGIALILALLVLAILIVLIGQMTVTSLHNRTVAQNQVADLQNVYGARSGYHLARVFLQADQEKAPNVDSLREKWAESMSIPLGGSQATVTVQDSERFINLSQLSNEKGEPNPVVTAQLQRLVQQLGHPPDAADRIIDYIDADAKGAYEARARNERLFNLDELYRIEGLPREVLAGAEGRKGILEFLTVWPRDPQQGGTPPGAVNVNTAPMEVLLSVSDKMTAAAAEAIVAFRAAPGPDGKPQEFQNAADVKKVDGVTAEIFASLAPVLVVRSETFEIRVRSAAGNVEKGWVYVVRRTGGPQAGINLLASQRTSDFLSVKPPEEKGP